MATTQETCTDVIVQAMESADEMATVIVIWCKRDVGEANVGIGWNSNATTFDAIAMLEMTKAGLLSAKDSD